MGGFFHPQIPGACPGSGSRLIRPATVSQILPTTEMGDQHHNADDAGFNTQILRAEARTESAEVREKVVRERWDANI